MRILGIDPGYGRCGVGIIEQSGNSSTLLHVDCIETSADLPFVDRLKLIHGQVMDLISLYKPELIGLEELFFAKNTKTALKVAHARGVLMLTAAQNGIRLVEFTPNQIKLALTGQGNADKRQIQHMTKLLLKLAEIPKPDDAADALAVALTAASWKTFSEK